MLFNLSGFLLICQIDLLAAERGVLKSPKVVIDFHKFV